MRGLERRNDALHCCVRLEERIPADHPLRAIRVLVEEVPNGLSAQFEDLHSRRSLIAPECLSLDDSVWHSTAFSHNRYHLFEAFPRQAHHAPSRLCRLLAVP